MKQRKLSGSFNKSTKPSFFISYLSIVDFCVLLVFLAFFTCQGVAVFTYALGSGADATITKRLACENKGRLMRVLMLLLPTGPIDGESPSWRRLCSKESNSCSF